MGIATLLHRRRNRRLDGRSERGAVIVELAMVVPILVLLIMGIVDYAVLFNQKIGLRGGVREATWNGSRGIFGAPVDPACNLTFSGILPDTNTQKLMCMVKRRSGLDPMEIRVMIRPVDLDNAGAAGVYDNGMGLMVCAMRRASSTTHFFSSLFTDTFQVTRLTSVILAIDKSVTVVGGGRETPFPNKAGGWSFCDPAQPAPG